MNEYTMTVLCEVSSLHTYISKEQLFFQKGAVGYFLNIILIYSSLSVFLIPSQQLENRGNHIFFLQLYILLIILVINNIKHFVLQQCLSFKDLNALYTHYLQILSLAILLTDFQNAVYLGTYLVPQNYKVSAPPELY